MNKKFNVLIIGGGLAGMFIALNLPKEITIAMVMKDTKDIANSELAQGGIASLLSKDD